MSKEDLFRWDRSEAEGSEFDESGFLSVQVNNCTGGGELGAWAHSPYGFLSRPLDPDGEGACHVLVAAEGDQKHAIATVDLRVLKKLPKPKKGGSMQFGSDGAFGSFDPEVHTHTTYVPVEFDSDGTVTKAHSINVGLASDGTALLSLVHANGLAILMQDDDKHSLILKNKEGNASIVLNDDGITFAGNVRLAGGLVAGSEAAKALVTAEKLIEYLTALEGAIAAKLPAGPVPTPVATVAATFTTLFTKAD